MPSTETGRRLTPAEQAAAEAAIAAAPKGVWLSTGRPAIPPARRPAAKTSPSAGDPQ